MVFWRAQWSGVAVHGVGDAVCRPEVCKTGKTSSLLDIKKYRLKNANNKPDVQTKKSYFWCHIGLAYFPPQPVRGF